MNKRKKYIKQKMVILCAFILGILIAIYIKTLNPQKVYITLEEKKNLEHKIEIENKQIEKLRNIKLEYEKDLEAYEQKSLNEKSVKELMEYELSYLKDATGESKVIGDGIIITIKVNDTTYGQPFIIKAIGDLNTLKASVTSPQSYTNILQEVYGIYIKVEEKNDIIINSFKKYE